MYRSILIFTLGCLVLLFNCSNSDSNIIITDDGGVVNGNPVISGCVKNNEGSFAKNTIIRLIPYNNNPMSNDSVTAMTITDDRGKYSFDSVKTGTYNIFGETSDGKLCFKDSVTVKSESSVIPLNIVKAPGNFKGVIKLKPYRQCMVLIVLLGTNTYTTTTDTIGNYSSPKLPEGKYTAFVISTIPEFKEQQIDIEIKSGRTTIVDTLVLPYIGVSVIDSVLLKKFHEINSNLPGTYTGVVTTPWIPPYNVAFVIDSNGHYSAFNATTRSCPALYYGTDDDDGRKNISLVQMNANGKISGTINVVFDSNTVLKDDIKELHFSPDFDSLQFDMYHCGTYGPLQISLHRISSDSLPQRPLPTPSISISGQQDIQMRGYLDSVVVSITVAGDYRIVYQVIDNPAANTYGASFSVDEYWKDDVPLKIYSVPFILNSRNSDILILARAIKDNSKSGVIGYRLNIL